VQFLQYASLLTVPVERSAFAEVSGALARPIISDLQQRLLINEFANGRITVHPLVAEHFRSQLNSDDAKTLHGVAFRYFDRLAKQRRLSMEESGERVFHAITAGEAFDLSAYKLFVGPARAAMLRFLQQRDYKSLEHTCKLILDVIPDDPTATLAYCVAREEDGESSAPSRYEPAIARLDADELWVAVELARLKVRLHDYQQAASILRLLIARFGEKNRILVAKAQLLERLGDENDAAALCVKVISDTRAHKGDLRSAVSVLRKANKLNLFLDHFDPANRPRDDRIMRQYAFAQVVTGRSPRAGLTALERFYSENATDGNAVADFAAALGHINEYVRAEKLFADGIKECDGEHLAAIMEEYGRFLQRRSRFNDANNIFRQLHAMRPHWHHVSRRFARCLFEEAKQAKTDQAFAESEVCLREAETVLTGLVQSATEDEWARYFLRIVQRQDFNANPHLPQVSNDTQADVGTDANL
jgi:Tfp pilus assembly protein PilF